MDVRYITINEEDLCDLPIIDGQIIALADTPRWYYDMNDTRYDASGTLYCTSLPPVDKALNGVIYILDRDPESSEEDPENRLNGAYLFLDGEYIKVSQLYPPASKDDLGLVKVGTNIDVSESGEISISSSKIKAIVGLATTYSTGLVRIGSGINVTPSGIISVPLDEVAEQIMDEIKHDPSVFPVATKDGVGVVRIGNNINVTNGLIDITSRNIIDALGYEPGHQSSTASAGSPTHPVYMKNGLASATGYYLDIWTTGNGKAASYSTSEGNMTTASGQAAHSEGNKTYAANVYAHVEGNMSTASGQGSHAQGYYTLAVGNYSDASGYMSTASGDYSIAGGNRAKTIANSAIAFGQYANATKDGSIVIGNMSTASRLGQLVIGSHGRCIENYETSVYMSNYYDSVSTAATYSFSTYVHGDVGNDYSLIKLNGARYTDPYPVAGGTNYLDDFKTEISRKEIPKGDTKNRYYKYLSTYSYDLSQEEKSIRAGTRILKFPFILNSGFDVSHKWTPIMTRIDATKNTKTGEVNVNHASTLISGLVATNVQPLLFESSIGPDDVHIMKLPDQNGSLIIFRCWYDTTSGSGTTSEKTIMGTTYVKLFYAIPCDESGYGYKDASNWTKYGCIAIQLGAAAVGGSKENKIGVDWLNTKVSDDSDKLSFEEGQFAFWCTARDSYKDTGNGTAYYVSCAVYSLPCEPEYFNNMWANRE